MWIHSTIIVLFGISMVSGIGSDLSHLCDHIFDVDCKVQYVPGERDETVCGSDGVTYINFCSYSQARCTDRNMELVYTGPCGGATTVGSTVVVQTTGATVPMTSTMAGSTMPPATTMDPLLITFCASKNTITCGQDLDPICGSDKKFYLNQCEFSKAYCDNLSLTSEDISFCTGKRAL